MKKTIVFVLVGSVLLSSCVVSDNATYVGTMAGAEIGGTLGEAIGWMSTSRHGGPGKAMLGSVIGTVVGAVAGNQLATAADPVARAERRERREAKRRAKEEKKRMQEQAQMDYQTVGGYDSQDNLTNNIQSNTYSIGSELIISNMAYQDEDGDGRFSRYETINVIYEVTNKGQEATEATLLIDTEENAKNYAFSPANSVQIAPGQTIRYKAKAFCKSKPADNYVNIKVSALSSNLGNASSNLRVRLK